MQQFAFCTHYCAFLLFASYIMVIIQHNSAFLDDLLCGSRIQDQEGEPRSTLSFWLQGSVALSLRSVYHLKEHSTYSHLFSTKLQFSYSQSLTPAPQRLFCVCHNLLYIAQSQLMFQMFKLIQSLAETAMMLRYIIQFI